MDAKKFGLSYSFILMSQLQCNQEDRSGCYEMCQWNLLKITSEHLLSDCSQPCDEIILNNYKCFMIIFLYAL